MELKMRDEELVWEDRPIGGYDGGVKIMVAMNDLTFTYLYLIKN